MSGIIPEPDWGRPVPHLTDDDIYEFDDDDEEEEFDDE